MVYGRHSGRLTECLIQCVNGQRLRGTHKSPSLHFCLKQISCKNISCSRGASALTPTCTPLYWCSSGLSGHLYPCFPDERMVPGIQAPCSLYCEAPAAKASIFQDLIYILILNLPGMGCTGLQVAPRTLLQVIKLFLL